MTRYRDEAHAEQTRKAAREYSRARRSDPVKLLAIQVQTRATKAVRWRADRLAALTKYGPGCRCCAEDREPFLVIDHVGGGGNAHRQVVAKRAHPAVGARSGGGPYFYRWLRLNGYPSGFQVLCANCNMAKDRPGGCPHQDMGGDDDCG